MMEEREGEGRDVASQCFLKVGAYDRRKRVLPYFPRLRKGE